MKPANDKRRHLDDAPCNAKNKRFHSDDTELLADSNDASGEGNSVKSANNSQMQISDVALKIMANMGYAEGKGLGRNEQGRQSIVEASTHRGRRGYGHKVEGFESSKVEWDFGSERVEFEEKIEWLPPLLCQIPDLQEMLSWKVVGPKKRTIDDEAIFCEKNVLENILSSKTIFDNLSPEEMRRARTRSNPYETIRKMIFLNRAAMKMANMDAVLDFMFTSPVNQCGKPALHEGENLYFADICSGPGGFSEYVLWRRNGESKGFGITLRGANDFNLGDFFAAHSEMFEPHYGVDGLNGDGDIFSPQNQSAFADFIMKSTGGKGVHFAMADGGFSVEGQENIQEILSKQLYLCQFLLAGLVIRPGGHFVCKVFDLFTPFSVGLLYLQRLMYHSIAIIKPVTSRPANSERYVVCKWRRQNVKPVLDYMDALNHELISHMSPTSTTDINHVVPLHVLQKDELFLYIHQSNSTLGIAQIRNLMKIQAFASNTNLYENRQREVRKHCLDRWKEEELAYYEQVRPELTENVLPKHIDSVYNYTYFVSGNVWRKYLISCGKAQVFQRLIGNKDKTWSRLSNFGLKVELPSNTLIEVEIVQYKDAAGGCKKFRRIHILDAFFLCGKDMRKFQFQKRQVIVANFVKALHKETRSDIVKFGVPDFYRLSEVEGIFDQMRTGDDSGDKQFYQSSTGNVFIPTGLILVKTVRYPWTVCMSKTNGRKYWFNTKTNKSIFDIPGDGFATFSDIKANQLRWSWPTAEQVPDKAEHCHEMQVSMKKLVRFVQAKLK